MGIPSLACRLQDWHCAPFPDMCCEHCSLLLAAIEGAGQGWQLLVMYLPRCYIAGQQGFVQAQQLGLFSLHHGIGRWCCACATAPPAGAVEACY